MSDSRLPRALFANLKTQLPGMLAALRALVLAESPSLEKAAADRCCNILVAEWRRTGAAAERLAQKHHGDYLRVTWLPGKSRPQGQLMVLGHYDTVYATGTLAKMPFRVAAGKAYGPGTFDMKAGIVQALFALRALQQAQVALRKRIVFLWTSDEEIGSDPSRRVIEREARRSDAVFVLEPSLGPRGLLKTARKAVGEMEIVVHGRASHAGLAPEKGVNAVHEIAHQLVRIQRWNDPRRGITLNADVIAGGSRANVIAEEARAMVDLRALRMADVRSIERRFHTLRPIAPGARIEVRGGFSRAPLERKMSAHLFARARTLASQMGMGLGECTAGGGSDGNFTAAAGVPTLDGLGAVGDGAHSANEHVLLREMPRRAALLAALLANS